MTFDQLVAFDIRYKILNSIILVTKLFYLHVSIQPESHYKQKNDALVVMYLYSLTPSTSFFTSPGIVGKLWMIPFMLYLNDGRHTFHHVHTNAFYIFYADQFLIMGLLPCMELR